jgi:hypothetical protein
MKVKSKHQHFTELAMTGEDIGLHIQKSSDLDVILETVEPYGYKIKSDIKLIKDYIHTRSAPFFDPYTQYWYKKIKKEILLNTRTIAQIREDKLKQLNIK